MQNPLLQQIDAIAKEKGVEPDVIIGAVQDAIEAAARKRVSRASTAEGSAPRSFVAIEASTPVTST